MESTVFVLFCCFAYALAVPVQHATREFNEDNFEEDIRFLLFSKNDSTPDYLTIGDEDALRSSRFNSSLSVKVVIHGFGGGLDDDTNSFITPALVEILDVNVIVVDYSNFGIDPELIYNLPLVAQYVASFLSWINSFANQPSNFHLIGFSLGGQMIGMAARYCDFRINHITSLDPANVLWETEPNVQQSDAEYVEVIHTSAGVVGRLEPLGHADFYPNKGTVMAGCEEEDLGCNHIRAVLYYADSIDHQRFKSIRCNNLDELLADACANTGETYMGGANPKNASGVYYLETNAEQPYYMD